MALKGRERWLAISAGSLAAVAAVQFGFNQLQTALDARKSQVASLSKEISDKEALVLRGKRAGKKLQEWQKRSLPSDLELARSLYRNWLAGIVEQTRLGQADVKPGADVPKAGVYTLLPFDVRGEGSLDQIVRLLYDFYRADHLHRVKQISLTPATAGAGPPGQARFGLVLSVEALALPGADRNDKLAEGDSGRLAWDGMTQYTGPILQRDLFSPYQPPAQRADPAQDTYFTGLVKDDGEYAVWVNWRSSGRLAKLRQGESFYLGINEATVFHIAPRGVDIDYEGKRRHVELGKSLAEGREVSMQQYDDAAEQEPGQE